MRAAMFVAQIWHPILQLPDHAGLEGYYRHLWVLRWRECRNIGYNCIWRDLLIRILVLPGSSTRSTQHGPHTSVYHTSRSSCPFRLRKRGCRCGIWCVLREMDSHITNVIDPRRSPGCVTLRPAKQSHVRDASMDCCRCYLRICSSNRVARFRPYIGIFSRRSTVPSAQYTVSVSHSRPGLKS